MKIEEINRARADFYAFLSRMFAEEPPRELAEDIAGGRFPLHESSSLNEDFVEGVNLLREFMKAEKDASRVYDLLCDEYTRLFLGPVPAMFPYESMYVDGSMMAKSLLRVKKEYRRAGLSKAKGYPEPEDHIALELGFMGYLCQKQSREFLEMQRDFLYDHLLKWVPGFCDKLCEKSRSDFFRGIGKITKGFLIMEKDVLSGLNGRVE